MKGAIKVIIGLGILSGVALLLGSYLIAAILFTGAAVSAVYVSIKHEEQKAAEEEKAFQEGKKNLETKWQRERDEYFHKHGIPRHDDIPRVREFAMKSGETVEAASDHLIDHEITLSNSEPD